MKTLEELNKQLQNVKNYRDFIQLYNDVRDNFYQLVHMDEYASLGCQYLAPNNYDIDTLGGKSNKFIVYGFMARRNVRFYTTMYKHFRISKCDFHSTNQDGTPYYCKHRYNIIG